MAFFDGIAATVRAKLDHLAHPRTYAPGDVLFQEGSPHDDVHVLISGRVRLEMLVPQRGRLPIMTLGPGDLLGWSPLFGEQPMTATAIAMGPVQTLAFDGRDLRKACESDHEMGYCVMRQLSLVLAQRLLATRLHLLDLFREQAPVHPPRLADAEC